MTNLVIDDQTDVSRLQDGFLGDCDNVFVYMTDSTNPGILVYDARRDTAWRLSHPFMFPDPDFGTMSVRFHADYTQGGINDTTAREIETYFKKFFRVMCST